MIRKISRFQLASFRGCLDKRVRKPHNTILEITSNNSIHNEKKDLKKLEKRLAKK
jgi:hypothetical protein